jgi:hypothetical protein
MRGASLVLLAIGFLGTSAGAMAGAEEIGIASLVRPEVRAFPPGEPSRKLVPRAPIERGMRVTLTGEEAFLKVDFTRAFGCKETKSFESRRISGVLTFLGPGDAELGDASRSCAPRVRFTAGKSVLAQLPGEPPVDVETPQAITRVKGTYVRFLVDPLVGTFVGVDEGIVSVQARAGGDPVEVAAGQWVVVPPGGRPTRPAPTSRLEKGLDDPPVQLRDFTTEPPRPPQ